MIEDHRTIEAPDVALAREQLRGILERAVAALSDGFRTVFVLRDIEGLSVEETAEALDLPGATVKSRLFRARRKLQLSLAPEVRSALVGTFPFAGVDCERLTARLLDAMMLPRAVRPIADGDSTSETRFPPIADIAARPASDPH
jgi:RNA polymerase sigma-70 factor (ECF subfamily)